MRSTLNPEQWEYFSSSLNRLDSVFLFMGIFHSVIGYCDRLSIYRFVFWLCISGIFTRFWDGSTQRLTTGGGWTCRWFHWGGIMEASFHSHNDWKNSFFFQMASEWKKKQVDNTGFLGRSAVTFLFFRMVIFKRIACDGLLVFLLHFYFLLHRFQLGASSEESFLILDIVGGSVPISMNLCSVA